MSRQYTLRRQHSNFKRRGSRAGGPANRNLHSTAVDLRGNELRGLNIHEIIQKDLQMMKQKESLSHTCKDTCSNFTIFYPIDILDDPDGWQRRSWDLFIVLLVLMLMVTVPFEACVTWWHPADSYYAYSYVTDGIFWLDILLNFFAAYYHGTELVTDQRQIVMHYVYGNPITHNTGWFWIDLLGNIPFELFQSTLAKHDRKAAKVLKWLKLPKLLRAGRLQKYMGKYVSFATFIQHAVVATFFLHLTACWFLGHYFEDVVHCHGHHDSHSHDDGLSPTPAPSASPTYYYDDDDECGTLFKSYGESLTSVMFIVVGGNPTVDGMNDNELEKFNITIRFVVVLLGTVIYWLLQADLVIVMQNSTNAYTRHRVTYKRAMEEVEYFQLPEDLKERVQVSMENRWHELAPSDCSLIHEHALSPMLRQDIVLHFHGESIRKTALFAGCSTSCVAAAALMLQTIAVPNYGYIIRRGQVGREIFLLSKGRAAAVASTGVVVGCVEEGSFFGETALVSKVHPFRTADVIALMWCELEMLSRDHFRELCKEYPDVLMNAENMMRLLQQDEQHANMLWSHYLRTKNKIYEETKKDWARDCKIDSNDPRLATEVFDEVLMHSTYIRKKKQLDEEIINGAFKKHAYANQDKTVKSDRRRLSIPIVTFKEDGTPQAGIPGINGLEMNDTTNQGNGNYSPPSTPSPREGSIDAEERGSWVPDGTPLEALSNINLDIFGSNSPTGSPAANGVVI